MGVRLSADELRERFLRFFEERGHRRLPSASLVPHGDDTLLLTGAGMVPFKPYFLGVQEPPAKRITTCQRCLRTPDIDQVGKTDRHSTFFEMLGNFSFGDYFKEEAIDWAWTFLTEELQIAPDRLWVTIYIDDDEAFDIWTSKIGVPAERVVRLGKDQNFWEIGVGPCGPCSELYVDRGEEFGCGGESCRPGCDDCERFMEVWNLVFIQYRQDEEGNLTPLAKKGIDTGMGLERMAAYLQGVPSNYDIDNVRPILDHIARRAGTSYGANDESDVSLRVITDHMRAIVFMIFDGILPGNEGRGYVLRRLLRRSVRHARLLGVQEAFLAELVQTVAEAMKSAYPELVERSGYIQKVVALEEERFRETLEQGTQLLRELIDRTAAAGRSVIAGDEAFRLYDTYGFPLELTEEIARDHGMEVDLAGFQEAMQRQREIARTARGQTGYLDSATDLTNLLDTAGPTEFVGYSALVAETRILAIISEGEAVGEVPQGAEAEIILDRTPFYPEGGGQVSDSGVITSASGQLYVTEVRRAPSGVIVHRGRVGSGVLRVESEALATVDEEERLDTARHHTATHLLHQALRDILGDHASQAGSLVAPDRLRFDFTHFEPVDSDTLLAIESRVNEHVLANHAVSAQVMSFDEARKAGAIALFGEKYGDRVRVVSIGNYSKELCGGTHVQQSGELGLFKIVTEGGVASGVRRIEAVCGSHALRHVESESAALRQVSKLVRAAPLETPQQIERLLDQIKSLEQEIDRLQARVASARTAELAEQAVEVDGIRLLAVEVEDTDMGALRVLGDAIRNRLGPSAFVLGSRHGGKAQLVAMASDEAVDRGIRAVEVIRKVAPIVGGGGGGHERMAQAGGKDPGRMREALDEARSFLHAAIESRQVNR